MPTLTKDQVLLMGDEEDFLSLEARLEYFKNNPQKEDRITIDFCILKLLNTK